MGSRYPFPAKTDLVDRPTRRSRCARPIAASQADRVLLVAPAGRHRARRRNPRRLAGQVDRPPRCRRRDSRRTHNPDPKAEFRRQLLDIRLELILGGPLRQPPTTEPGDLGSVHRDDRSRNGHRGRHLVPLLRRRPNSDYLGNELAATRPPPTASSRSTRPSKSPARQPSSLSETSRPPTPKMAGFAGHQVATVAQNITALTQDDPTSPTTSPWASPSPRRSDRLEVRVAVPGARRRRRERGHRRGEGPGHYGRSVRRAVRTGGVRQPLTPRRITEWCGVGSARRTRRR